MSLNRLTEVSAVDGPREAAPSPNSAHLRQMAQRLRSVARDCRFTGARREMLDLAARFDRRADYFDWHYAAFEPGSRPRCLGGIEY